MAAVLELLRLSDTPALASDLGGHVLVWNAGAEKLFNRPERLARGRLCHDLLQARDVFGNRFCHERCSVRAMCAKGETIQTFELMLGPTTSLQVSILRIPGGAHPESDVIVHLLRPLDREGRLARELSRLGLAGLPAGTPKPPDAKSAPAPLTIRERGVLGLVAEGLQNKEIADRLDISLATARNHVHNVLEKLGVHSKLEAISLAYREGWALGPRESRSERTDRARRSQD